MEDARRKWIAGEVINEGFDTLVMDSHAEKLHRRRRRRRECGSGE